MVLYPPHQVVLPPNLGELEVHWQDRSGNDLFEVSVGAPLVDVRIYVQGAALASAFVALTADEWSLLPAAARGGELRLRVRGLRQAAPGVAGNRGAAHLARGAAGRPRRDLLLVPAPAGGDPAP